MTLSELNIMIDEDLKNTAKKVFEDLGIDLTTAITLFFKQSIKEQTLTSEPIKNIIARYQAENNLVTEINSIEELLNNLNDET